MGMGVAREVTKVVLPILALFAYAVGMVWGTPPGELPSAFDGKTRCLPGREAPLEVEYRLVPRLE